MATTLKNFLVLTNSTPVGMIADVPNTIAQLAAYNVGIIVDKITVDLAGAGYAKNAGFYLALASSTPQTVDMTNIGALSVRAGDTSFATANEIILRNNGAYDVTFSPGASNGFVGWLGGSSQSLTIPAGSEIRLKSVAGYTVDSTHKNLKFDPGSNNCTIAVALGGA